MPAPTQEQFNAALQAMGLEAPSTWALYVAIADLQQALADLRKEFGDRLADLERPGPC